MAVQRINIEHSFPFAVSRLFDYMSEHENLSTLFAPAKVSRLRNGDQDRNGVGSVRKLRIAPGPAFEETVTVFVPNERIEYRITRGSPLKNHYGIMRFSGNDQEAHLHYTIEFEGKLPGIAAVIRPVLEQSIRRGLAALTL